MVGFFAVGGTFLGCWCFGLVSGCCDIVRVLFFLGFFLGVYDFDTERFNWVVVGFFVVT